MTAEQSTVHQPKLHIFAALLAVLGMADSIYLTVTHLTGENVTCVASSGCNEVLSSPYASVGPIPLGAFGVLGYFLAFSLAILTAFGSAPARIFFRLQVAVMLAVTCWLLYVQAFVLHHFCDFCLLSAALTTSLSLIVLISLFVGRTR